MSENNLNVDLAEISKFEEVASRWWDLEGEFKPLHDINPLRLGFVEDKVSGLFGKKVLDVGCGGGILSESMAKLGAEVSGIDMGEEPLNVARLHALESQVEVNYQRITVEELAAQQPGSFDIVTCMEMLEHVPEPASVVRACSQLVKPGGYVFFSTLNKTLKSYLFAILGAEKILKLVPEGTHEHDKFIRPADLMGWAENEGLRPLEATGIHYNPLTKIFKLGPGLDVNYIIATQSDSD
ncbi:bifunctional 2-polyprenyl-6-hydroxyphenol methylase/3-demethylubiquinol 3-O-methyltransferase UbiG [Algicola sagamiensis]|uniref:bifunctional 2-polyprenyl-6-hydroxyphenol methylase/3-demethylubiquinol 3-O-methyltransferase UbiG n=1 Tax=Algicola sagamiensis TaxID=163869 RepID=UPI000364F5E2|nr:bifunctional 2-polyprenyl-6-hydroxyphenol methylase/3-demethylubiquinol 3-O-methyltransferase UbiG [Algicola sagamiensis]